MSAALVEARQLKVHFAASRRLFGAPSPPARAVDGVDLGIAAGETLALVGESGCGKSTVGRALLGMEPVTSGSVWFEGTTISGLKEHVLRPLRKRMQMVFQDPYASLNPRMTVGETVAEPLQVHGLAVRGKLKEVVAETLEMVGAASSGAAARQMAKKQSRLKASA